MYAAPTTIMALAVLLSYTGFCYAIWRRHHRTRPTPTVFAGDAENRLLVAYASQGGMAEGIARDSAAALSRAGHPAEVLPLNAVDTARLDNIRQALFVVSTYGEGEPPDNGALFARRCLNGHAAVDLSGLRYGVLALGDRRYRHFCGFGKRLHRELARRGARPLLDPIRVDRGDEQALHAWRQALETWTGVRQDDRTVQPAESRFACWRLQRRELLNPGSPGEPLYWLCLEPADTASRELSWQAGDIVRVLPGDGASTDDWREYSIASLPADGSLDLVVRQRRHNDGTLGWCSGWLTEALPVGSQVRLGLRCNAAFHAPADGAAMILIGSGTGMAGLRVHLKAREQHGVDRNWLLFGERTATHDALFDAEIRRWRQHRHLQRLDRVYSRDGRGLRYVQHALQAAANEFRRWVDQGACLYVCGSRERMATGVDRVLREMLGEVCVDRMIARGRYRRDVY